MGAALLAGAALSLLIWGMSRISLALFTPVDVGLGALLFSAGALLLLVESSRPAFGPPPGPPARLPAVAGVTVVVGLALHGVAYFGALHAGPYGLPPRRLITFQDGLPLERNLEGLVLLVGFTLVVVLAVAIPRIPSGPPVFASGLTATLFFARWVLSPAGWGLLGPASFLGLAGGAVLTFTGLFLMPRFGLRGGRDRVSSLATS